MNKTKQFLLTFLFILFFFYFSVIKVSAHNSYYLAITIDEAANVYRGEVIYEIGDHREVDVGDFSKWVDKSEHKMTKGKKLPEFTDEDDIGKLYDVGNKGDNNKMYYTFPSIHSLGWWKDKVDATDKDLQLVQRIVDYPLAGLNDAISFIREETGLTNGTSSNKETTRNIGMHLGNYEKSFEINDVKVSANWDATGDAIENKSIKPSDYVEITINGKSKKFIYKCYKGYQEKENDKLFYMNNSRYSDYLKKLDKNGEQTHMTWRMLVLQGNYNYDNGTTYSSITNISAPNEFQTIIINFIDSTLNSIQNFLGLYRVEELMTNSGARNTNYNLGMFPSSWTNSAVLLHIICQMIAWGLIGFSIIKMLWQKQIATMNIGQKIALQESIKNLILCGVLLGSFTLVFNFLARVNYRLVDLFTASTKQINLVSAAGSNSTMGGLIVAIGVFSLTVYFNFYYIVRAVELAILYGIAPLCIYTLSLGGKTAGTFTTFLKELLGNMFTQTIHALCIAFFSNVFLSSSTRAFESLIIMYSFIPITNFIRKKVFGLEDGVSAESAQQALGGVSTGLAVASGAAGGLMAGGAIAGGAMARGSKGGSKNSSDGSINQKIDSKISNPRGDSDVTMKDPKQGGYKESRFQNVTSPISRKTGAVRHATKAVGNAIMAPANLAMGAASSVVNPKASTQFFRNAVDNVSNIGSNVRNLGNDISATKILKGSFKKNGVANMKANKGFVNYGLDGKFDDNGKFVGNKGNDHLNQKNVKEYEAMYRTQKRLSEATGKNFNDLDYNLSNEDIKNINSKIPDKEASKRLDNNDIKILNNMKRQQVRLHQSENGSYGVLRRAEDINHMQNPLDRYDPMSGVKISGRNENRDIYSNRENQRKK